MKLMMAAKEAPKVNEDSCYKGGAWWGVGGTKCAPDVATINPSTSTTALHYARQRRVREGKRERVPQRHTVHNANIKRSRISQQQTISANLNLKISTQ